MYTLLLAIFTFLLLLSFFFGIQASIGHSQLMKKLNREQPSFLKAIVNRRNLIIPAKYQLYWRIFFGSYRKLDDPAYKKLFDKQKLLSRASLIAMFLATISLIVCGIWFAN